MGCVEARGRLRHDIHSDTLRRIDNCRCSQRSSAPFQLVELRRPQLEPQPFDHPLYRYGPGLRVELKSLEICLRTVSVRGSGFHTWKSSLRTITFVAIRVKMPNCNVTPGSLMHHKYRVVCPFFELTRFSHLWAVKNSVVLCSDTGHGRTFL